MIRQESVADDSGALPGASCRQLGAVTEPDFQDLPRPVNSACSRDEQTVSRCVDRFSQVFERIGRADAARDVNRHGHFYPPPAAPILSIRAEPPGCADSSL